MKRYQVITSKLDGYSSPTIVGNNFYTEDGKLIDERGSDFSYTTMFLIGKALSSLHRCVSVEYLGVKYLIEVIVVTP